jgi:chromate transporter
MTAEDRAGDDADTSGSDADRPAADAGRPAERAGEVARLFLRLGVTAFGGPAAHIALMHEEVVRRRRWVDEERFVDLVGATNLVPGPNSTELAIHLGWDRARWRGLVAAGVAFILPAALMVGALAWVYVTYGDTPALDGVLYGVTPVVVAIVARALVAIAPAAAKTWPLGALMVLAAAGYGAGVHELALLAAGGVAGAALHGVRRWRGRGLAAWLPWPLLAAAPAVDVDRMRLFLVFLRVGAVLYGSGYVLLAFLQGELVDRLGWLTGEQLLDAVSIGQVTPGPVFTTATFVGYVVAGPWGAVLATVGIFLPSFAFVALLTRLVAAMRASPTFGAALDGLNAAAVGLMAAVGAQLAGEALVDALTVLVAVAAGVALWRSSVNSAWLIAAGAAVGLAHAAVG